MSEIQDELPPEFDACLNDWRQADRDAQLCFARYQIRPTFLTRLAIAAAWAALEVALGALEAWLITHPRTRATRAIDHAQSSWNSLHAQIERAGLPRIGARTCPGTEAYVMRTEPAREARLVLPHRIMVGGRWPEF